jgi:hypothetical protein
MTRNTGATYKLRVPDDVSKHAIYFTIVGEPEVEWFFINSKSMESFQWITALMVAWSSELEAGVSIEKIIADMKNTFQPGGAYYIGNSVLKGEVSSIVHHMGLVLERHVGQVRKKN